MSSARTETAMKNSRKKVLKKEKRRRFIEELENFPCQQRICIGGRLIKHRDFWAKVQVDWMSG